MKRMLKRYVAFVLFLCMLLSSPLGELGAVTAYAQEAETENESTDVAEETTEAPEESVPENVANPEDLNPVQNGVVASEDVRPIDNKVEIPTEEMSGDIIEKIDRDELDVDLVHTETAENAGKLLVDGELIREEDMVRVIIVMDGDSIIEEDSEATLNDATRMKMRGMESRQDSVISKIENNVLNGESLNVRYHYTWLLNGIAAGVPYGSIDRIEAVNGVKQVIIQPVYSMLDDDETVANPYTISDGSMIGREDVWNDYGYTGKGMKIAVIDSGIDDDHPNFAALPEDALTADSATESSIAEVLGQLNSSEWYQAQYGKSLTAGNVYRSTKIAYGFNYVDNGLIINHDSDKQGDHGTHVSGIAAANDLHNGEAVGVAPDAQLYVMKVFGQSGGAYADDIAAALEDALLLGADVVNMSLGSPAGFSVSDIEEIDEIYNRVSSTKTILAVAAGNAATSGQGNALGTNTNLAANPDNSTISSPAIWSGATSVASVNNQGIKGQYIEVTGRKISYRDASNGLNRPFVTLGGKEYEYAVVGHFGQTAEDFAAAGVEGKIAPVQRGVSSFVDKCQLADEAGAIACIVYNNGDEAFGMDMTGGTSELPCISISIGAGEYMVEALEDAQTKVFVSAEEAIVTNELGYKMSDFSSWGVSPDLRLVPDITAPGGDIYSTLDHGKYGLMSGTSMASPNMAGVAALVMQYVKETYPEMSASQKHAFVNALLLSTAAPLPYNQSVTYSPRLQGAGLVNGYHAIATRAYLSVDGMDVPKVELKDDAARTGSYSYQFEVNNFGDAPLYYTMDTTVQTEDVLDLGVKFMNMTPVAPDASAAETSASMSLIYDYDENNAVNSHDAYLLYVDHLGEKAYADGTSFRYNLDKNETADRADVQAYLDELVEKECQDINGKDIDLNEKVLKVAAGKSAAVAVSIEVSAAGKSYMDANFENGIYVEGFTYLNALNDDGVDLSLPYMGFYGDWTAAPVIDSGFYYEPDEEIFFSMYPNVLFTQFGKQDWVPGINPYLNEAFDLSHVSLSPNGDGYADYIFEIYLSLLRNAKTLTFTYRDAEDAEKVYFEEVIEQANKTLFNVNYNQVVPYVHSWYSSGYTLTDENGASLPNNTRLNLEIQAALDYDVHESDNVRDHWTIPITIDTEAPTVDMEKTILLDGDDGRKYLKLSVTDNVDIAAISITNKSGLNVYAQYPVEDLTAGEYKEMLLDVTGYGNVFAVILGDYALNESAYVIRTTNNDPELDKDSLYAYRVYDENYQDDRLFGRMGVNKENASLTAHSSEYYMDYALTAAEYAGGYIIAVDANNDLVAIKPGYWDERTKITSLGKKVSELAFDPVEQVLYGYSKSDWAIHTIDITTGEMVKVSKGYITSFTAMTCGNDGTLYVLDGTGKLKAYDKETKALGEEVLLNTTEVTKTAPAPYAQSMTFDAEEECIYWAGYFGSVSKGMQSTLYKIDVKNDYEMTKVGDVAGKAQLIGLLKLDERGYQIPEASIETLAIEQNNVVLLVGTQTGLTPVITPWYAETGDLTWTSDDPSVVTVDEDGVLTGTGVGTATVTVEVMDGAYRAECVVSVVNPQMEFTGFVMGGNTLYNQWVHADITDLEHFETLSESDFMSFSAGEYVDGTIYAYSPATEFYHIDAETKKAEKISDANKEYQIVEMSYDYSTGYMYGIAQSSLDGMTYLVHIDRNTGAPETVAPAMDYYGAPICAMAVATDGTIYMISYTGLLNRFDLETNEVVRIGLTGFTGSQMLQSMAYDHNTGSLYWAMISSANETTIAYIDTASGKALPLGAFDGGVQMTSMYIMPEEVPDREDVAVTSVELMTDSVIVLEGSRKLIPVEVQPFNATDRDVIWTVEDPEIASIEHGIVTAKSVGDTTATGTLGDFTVQVEIHVIRSAGEIRGYVLSDLATGSGSFWGAFDDRDLSAGEGIASGSQYLLTAGEYYDGKVYGYGFDEATYDSQFMVLDGETLELEKTVVGEYPDMRDMAFDYSEGCMYAIGGIRNVEDKSTLYVIDIAAGTAYAIADFDEMMFGLACSTDGVLYGMSMEGVLYTIDKRTAELTEIGETGYYANQYQSMAYDHNTGNLYWAQMYHDMMTWQSSADLLLVNTEDASVIVLGQIGMAGCQVTGMHIVPKSEIPVGTPEISMVMLSSKSEVMQPGDTVQLSAKPFPISVAAEGAEISYQSSNPDVATVDDEGMITAKAAGEARIIVSCKTAEAECRVTVVDHDTKLHVINRNGWQTSPLLAPATIDTETSFPEEMGSIIAATVNEDGYFYAVDEEGYLWKYSEDLTTVEKIGDDRIAAQFDNLDKFNLEAEEARVIDIAAAGNGTVYVLGTGVTGEDPWDMNWEYFVYELNLETGAATKAAEVPWGINYPVAMTFTDPDTIVMFDGFEHYLYSIKLGFTKEDHPTALVWAQNVVTAGETMGMTYSAKLDLIFLATADGYNNNGKLALYVMNPAIGTIAKVDDAAYDADMVDLILVECELAAGNAEEETLTEAEQPAELTESETAEPETTKPETAESEATESETAEPETTESETTVSEAEIEA